MTVPSYLQLVYGGNEQNSHEELPPVSPAPELMWSACVFVRALFDAQVSTARLFRYTPIKQQAASGY